MGGSKKKTKLKTDTKKPDKTDLSVLGGVWAVVTNACDTLLTFTALFKDGARKQKGRIERRISNGQDLFMRATNSTRR